jgi:fermentation-respiration switch protein FrsA (DUF1100 family)
VRLLPFDKFDNLSKISAVLCPVLFIHGKDDRVVPLSHGESLYDTARTQKHMLWVEHGGHNDLLDWAGPTYWETLNEFTRTLD